jgi:hypothetical protein
VASAITGPHACRLILVVPTEEYGLHPAIKPGGRGVEWNLSGLPDTILGTRNSWCNRALLCGLNILSRVLVTVDEFWIGWLDLFGYRSRGPEFDYQRYHIFWEVVGLEPDPLSLVSTIKELLRRNSGGSGLENREYCRGDPWRWPRDTLYQQKLALT